MALKQSNNLVYEADEMVDNDFLAAEMTYRKALSKQPSNTAGTYNLGNAYYMNGKYSEAILRHQEAIKSANTKSEKHRAYHNLGNALMQKKQCKEAVEAFKNALRNDPSDEETRYNFALAKECAKEQGSGGGGEDENKEDQENQNQKEQQEQQDQNNDQDQQNQDNQEQDNQDQNQDNQDKKEGDQEQDEKGKPDDKQQDQGQDKQEDRKPKQQQGQLSHQQIKNLLEAMNDHEQKVQDKMNAQKVQGGKVKTDKDW